MRCLSEGWLGLVALCCRLTTSGPVLGMVILINRTIRLLFREMRVCHLAACHFVGFDRENRASSSKWWETWLLSFADGCMQKLQFPSRLREGHWNMLGSSDNWLVLKVVSWADSMCAKKSDCSANCGWLSMLQNHSTLCCWISCLYHSFRLSKKCSDKSQFGYVQAYGCKSLRICFLHEIIRENTTIRKLHSTYFQAWSVWMYWITIQYRHSKLSSSFPSFPLGRGGTSTRKFLPA